jgi:homoserine dehydrogenase
LRAALSSTSTSAIRLCGFANSRTLTRVNAHDDVQQPLTRAGEVSDEEIASCVDGSGAVCVVDCTSSPNVSARYAPWLEQSWHVVTCNKKVNSGDIAYYKRCVDATQSTGGKWFVEATIGAGLPIVSTLRTLRATGDSVEIVQGIFSGTMSFLFNTWDGKSAFSEIVKLAKDAGYTEPDPREDLNGLDVARKVVIAARECGMMISLSDVDVESMVPSDLELCSTDEFMKRFHENDESMAQRARAAAETGAVLRFVGCVDVANNKASVSLATFPNTHPFATLSGADNIFEIRSARYGPTGSSTPLIIRGPGAGAEVTAAGVYGDIVQLAKEISTRYI